MKLLRKIDFLTDKKTNLWLNIGALLLILPFLFFFAWVALELLEEDEGLFVFTDFLYLFALLVVHELIHGFFFKIFGNEKTKVKFGFKNGMAYATSPGSFYSRGKMLIIALASIHAASCIGDFYLSYILISQKEEILVEDTEVGLNIYRKD
ncbi:MAG: DUF3267 domain-containing protein [Streptococcus gordonii]|nr:DUF3267 domain-containing protein [Streptococcus gordonii]